MEYAHAGARIALAGWALFVFIVAAVWRRQRAERAHNAERIEALNSRLASLEQAQRDDRRHIDVLLTLHAQMSAEPVAGPLWVMFATSVEGSAPCEALLAWHSDAPVVTLSRVSREPGVAEAVPRLLQHDNWRYQLVAAAWMALTDDRDADRLSALWDRIARGSWVTPQLLVVVHHLDPAFGARVAEVIDGLDPKGQSALNALQGNPWPHPQDGDAGHEIAAHWQVQLRAYRG